MTAADVAYLVYEGFKIGLIGGTMFGWTVGAAFVWLVTRSKGS